MAWIEAVKERLKRGNKILFKPDDVLLHNLSTLVEQQGHQTMVLWALEAAEALADVLGQRYPEERRPHAAVETARAWSHGAVKMPLAQRAILDAHAFAKEIEAAEDIALCHAIGQACGVVHAPGHAMGLPVYELTALVWRHGIDACEDAVEERVRGYAERLNYWRASSAAENYGWAGFLAE